MCVWSSATKGPGLELSGGQGRYPGGRADIQGFIFPREGSPEKWTTVISNQTIPITEFGPHGDVFQRQFRMQVFK